MISILIKYFIYNIFWKYKLNILIFFFYILWILNTFLSISTRRKKYLSNSWAVLNDNSFPFCIIAVHCLVERGVRLTWRSTNQSAVVTRNRVLPHLYSYLFSCWISYNRFAHDLNAAEGVICSWKMTLLKWKLVQ